MSRNLSTKELVFAFDLMAKGAKRDLYTNTTKDQRAILKPDELEAATRQIEALLEVCKKVGGVEPATILLKAAKPAFQPSIF